MPTRIVVDSGPLLALFDRDDRVHARAVEFLRDFRGEMLTNVAVLTEVVYLLDFSISAQTDFLTWICRGGVTVVPLSCEDLQRSAVLMEKYADRPMDFADATLVAISERLKLRDVASVDSDFLIYRLHGSASFRNVFPRP